MGVLQRFEERLEHMVTGTFARVFRSAVQPVEIAAALQREVDNSAQILSRNRRMVPNTFVIELSPTDHERLSPYGATLAAELTDMLREHADEQHYVFAGPISVRFQESERLTTGRFRVESRAMARVTPVEGQRMTETAVRRAPVILEVNGMQHPLEPPGLVVGRGSDADLRVNDPGVSRRHVELRVQPTKDGVNVTLVDLGSTNGTRVNGQRVQHITLTEDADINIGNTTMALRHPRHQRPEPAQSPPMDSSPPSAGPAGTPPPPGASPGGRKPSPPNTGQARKPPRSAPKIVPPSTDWTR